MTNLIATRSFVWRGREDTEEGQLGRRWHHALSNTNEASDIGLIGFCCDLGVAENKGRVGAKEGPNAIRSALANFAFHGASTIYDHGNIVAQDSLQQAQSSYSGLLSSALQRHKFVVSIGGGHEIAWATYAGLSDYLKQHDHEKKVGIINFDAHFDLRKPSPNPSSGTPFYQISQHCIFNQLPFHYACVGVAEPANTQALYARADSLGVAYIKDEDCTFQNVITKLTPMLKSIDELYVTVCLDVFSAEVAPGVSAPASLGVERQLVIDVIRWLWQQQSSMQYRWRVMDIAEMNPCFDSDNRTAKLAARLIHETTRLL